MRAMLLADMHVHLNVKLQSFGWVGSEFRYRATKADSLALR
jgi:hypothetical protein